MQWELQSDRGAAEFAGAPLGRALPPHRVNRDVLTRYAERGGEERLLNPPRDVDDR